ncbi:MAG: hypothetical protein ACM31L_08930 [Actinomycetota bacterium]
MSARGLAHAVFRHGRLFVAVLVLALAGGGALALRPPAWRAEAGVTVDGNAEALAAVLASRDLHRAVLERVALYPGLSEDEAVAAFGRDLELRPRADAGVVWLALSGPDPRTTAAALAALIDQARAGSDAAPRRQRLDPAGERQVLAARRAEAEGQAASAEARAAELADRLTALKARLAATPPTLQLSSESDRSHVIDQAKAKLFELSTREQELLGKYQDGSITVRNLRAEKAKVEELLKGLEAPVEGRVTNGPNPLYQDIEKDVVRAEADLTAARARGKALARQIADIDHRLDALAAEAASTRPQVPALGMLEHAQVAARPLGPRPAALMAAAGAIGLVLALLAALAAERLSGRFATPADVERRLGLKVLSSLPRER